MLFCYFQIGSNMKKLTSVALDVKIVDALEKESKNQHRSRNNLVNLILLDWLKGLNAK